MNLRVGIAGDLPGMGFSNPKTHRIEGFEADLARLLAQRLSDNPKVEFVKIPPAERLAFLKEDRVDCVIAELTITPERSEQIDFSKPYFIAKEALLVPKGSSIRRLSDLKGKRVAVAKGTITLKHFQTFFPNAELIITERESGGIDALKSKKADAMANDNVNLRLLRASLEDPDQFTLVDIGDDFPKKPFGIGVKKGRRDLLERINRALTELKSSGGLKNLLDKYGMS